jgi:hypothetical protein
MCVVVAGDQCANSKAVFEKRLGQDVRQLVRAMGLTTTSINVTTMTIMMASSNQVRPAAVKAGGHSTHHGLVNIHCSTAACHHLAGVRH